MRQGEQDGSQSVPTEKTQGLFSWRSPTSRAGLSAPQSTPSTSSAEATPQLRKSGCMTPCAFCGKEIWDKPSAKRVTCSKDCKNALDIRPENLITLCKVCHGSMHGGKESREIIKNQLYQILELAELSGELLI